VIHLKLLGVPENIFTYNGYPKHEIVFVYDGKFKDPSVYLNQELKVVEDNGDVFKATWHDPDFFNAYVRLVPEGLDEMLGSCLATKF